MPQHFLRISIALVIGGLLFSACSQALTGNSNMPAALTSQPEALTQGPISNPADTSDFILIALEENGYTHLFAYKPGMLPLTRLTSGAWSDVTPAVSPNGALVAFASNRGGYWDLYLLDIRTGGVRQLTNTPAYDGSPSWSPDGQWLAFETYVNNSLEIAVVSVTDPNQPVVHLTDNRAADYSPAWAPDGRHIAFVSTRGGDSDIWLADLNRTDEGRFTDLSNTPNASENHPVWNRDGSRLAWSSSAQTMGASGIYIWDASHPDRPADWVGDGDWPAWNPSGDRLVVLITGPNQEYLTSYTLTGQLLLQPMPLPGMARGLLWQNASLPTPLPASFTQAASFTPVPLWSPVISSAPNGAGQRWTVVPLPNVQAPYPQLHDLVNESFEALRQRVTKEAGWDALASLENAFVPLTAALDPGFGNDWLYTGRAFAINTLMVNAGWMTAVREDIGAETYWRLYIRACKQDGSQGAPIQDAPWDLNARYNLDPHIYEQGGTYAAVPPGYWVDVTSLAQAYGWSRLPALSNWRTYYAGARTTEFVMTGGLDWYAAMLELYPPDALLTPTPVLAPTLTPTRTPYPTDTLEPTGTPHATFTPSLSPTPGTPTSTPTITFTPLPTSTPVPTSTPPTIIPTFNP